MPSPFPGMDPHLESPHLWPGFHNAFADPVHDLLNRSLPQPYYALLETHVEITLTHFGLTRVIRPDVTMDRSSRKTTDVTATAVADEVRTEVSESVKIEVECEPVELASVVIKDSKSNHEVVTAIEMISPTNKRPCEDRERYLEKRKEILGSGVSLVEIDLLREGRRPYNEPEYGQTLFELEPRPHYLVAVNRSWRRGPRLHYQLFPIVLRDPLPVIPVPLREGDGEISLDLRYVFHRVYDGGPYGRGAVDYSKPPDPELPGELIEWSTERVKQWLAANP